MRRASHTLAALLVTLAGVVGCADDEPETDVEAKPTTSSTPTPSATPTPTGPQYEGPAIPGLADEPAWSVEGDRNYVVFGDAVAIWKLPESGDEEVYTAEIHDLATGEVRTTLEVDMGTGWPDTGDTEAYAGTWRGEPVLYYEYSVVQESDGLSAEKATRVAEAYNTAGEPVGSYEQDAKAGGYDMVDGWVLREIDNRDAEVVSADGEVVVESVCGDQAGVLNCHVEVANNRTVLGGAVRMLTISDGAVFQPAGRGAGSKLVVTDLETGEQLWTSDDIAAPEGVPPAADVNGLNALPVAAVDGNLILHWRHVAGFFETSAPETTISVHDPTTGELVLTGPTMELWAGSGMTEGPTYHVDVDATIAVMDTGDLPRHAMAIDLGTGEVLWEQAKDETSLWPHSVVGGVIYGWRRMTSDVGDQPIAVDLATREVVDEDLTDVPVPEQLPDGNGLVATDEGLFVFPAAS